MPFVFDASIAAAWALADESSEFAEAVQNRLLTDIGLVPPIWWCEVRNILAVNERRGRIGPDESDLFLALLATYPIEIDPFTEHERTFQLARQHRLTVYDAAYLELASRKRLPLATLDHALEEAALAAGVGGLAHGGAAG